MGNRAVTDGRPGQVEREGPGSRQPAGTLDAVPSGRATPLRAQAVMRTDVSQGAPDDGRPNKSSPAHQKVSGKSVRKGSRSISVTG